MPDSAIPLTCFHNHLIPGVDDGARTPRAAREALMAMRDQGVRRLVATPHFDGSLTERRERAEERLAEIDAGWTRLLEIAAGVPEILLGRGVEFRLDTARPDLSDARLRLDGGRSVLLEFSWGRIPLRASGLLSDIQREGRLPVVVHPERYPELQGRGMDRVAEWLDAGAVLQVNAFSLLGGYGNEARKAGWTLLERGWASAICSDFHPRSGRTPALREAYDAVAEAGGAEHARLLFSENPARIVDGHHPLEVPPVPRPGVFRRLVRGLGRRRG